jgi:hypothetical protein
MTVLLIFLPNGKTKYIQFAPGTSWDQAIGLLGAAFNQRSSLRKTMASWLEAKVTILEDLPSTATTIQVGVAKPPERFYGSVISYIIQCHLQRKRHRLVRDLLGLPDILVVMCTPVALKQHAKSNWLTLDCLRLLPRYFF